MSVLPLSIENIRSLNEAGFPASGKIMETLKMENTFSRPGKIMELCRQVGAPLWFSPTLPLRLLILFGSQLRSLASELSTPVRP